MPIAHRNGTGSGGATFFLGDELQSASETSSPSTSMAANSCAVEFDKRRLDVDGSDLFQFKVVIMQTLKSDSSIYIRIGIHVQFKSS